MLDIDELGLESKDIHPSKELASEKCSISDKVNVHILIARLVVKLRWE
jgi:hypothetical protein